MTNEKLHLRDLLVDFLHELDDKVDKLVLKHFFGMEVCDEEGDIIAFNGLASQDEEGFGTLSEEASELVDKNSLNLVCLLDLDADAHTVDTRLDEDLLILVTCDDQGVQKNFGRRLGLYLGYIVPL
jgi:hypothetical protein